MELCCCEFVTFQVCCTVAVKSGNGSQSSSVGYPVHSLLTAQDERLGFEAAVTALGRYLSQ